MQLHNIQLNRPETFTQAYHAGVIIAMIHNLLPKEKIPSIVYCMIQPFALRTLLGERLWQKIKHRSKFKSRVHVYEMLTYQPFLPKSIIGTSEDFMLGYVRAYERSNLKRETDTQRHEDLKIIAKYLS